MLGHEENIKGLDQIIQEFEKFKTLERNKQRMWDIVKTNTLSDRVR